MSCTILQKKEKKLCSHTKLYCSLVIRDISSRFRSLLSVQVEARQMVVHRRFGRGRDMCRRHLILLHCHTSSLHLHRQLSPPPSLTFTRSLPFPPYTAMFARGIVSLRPQSTHADSVGGAHVGAQIHSSQYGASLCKLAHHLLPW